MAAAVVCGFCHRGKEVVEVCGKLWHDERKNCTAHQRCMQFSACLSQYKMKRFGGFKVLKVLKELNRGKRLKCAICGKGKKSANGATAGCAVQTCRKTFHFYCARSTATTVARKMVETQDDGTDIDRYLVFCSLEHQQKYENKLKNRVRYVPDTDDEVYDKESTEDSDASDDSNTSNNKTVKQSTSQSTQLKRHHSDSDDDDKPAVAVTDNSVHTSATDRVSVDTTQSDAGTEAMAAKRAKVDDSPSDVNSHVFVVCFVEHVDRVMTASVTTLLQKSAWDWFHVTGDKVYVWQYNGRTINEEHFVYLLNDIGKALATGDRATLQRLVFSMHDSDVASFDERIRHNSTLDDITRRALYSNIRKQVVRNFESANKRRSDSDPVCRYCQVLPLKEYVAFVMFSENAEFQVEASSQNSTTQSAVSDKAEGNSIMGKTSCNSCRADAEVTKMAVDSQSETKGQVKQQKSTQKKSITRASDAGKQLAQKKSIMPPSTQDKQQKAMVIQASNAGKLPTEKESVSSDVKVARNWHLKEQKSRNVLASDTRVTQAEEEVNNRNMEVCKDADLSRDVVDEVTSIVEEEEPVDKPSAMSPPDQPDRSLDQRSVDNQPDLCGQSTDKIAVSPPRDSDVNSLSDVNDKLYECDNDIELKTDESANSVERKNTEFKKLSNWLSSRIDSTTNFHRFPTLYDFPVLGPRENPEWSVTWRLAEKFMPFKPALAGKPNDTRDGDLTDVLSDGKAASDVVFIGPYDVTVVKQREVVRRRVSQICEDMLPVSTADILCVTDVGFDVSLSRVSDIVDTSRLSACQFGAFTAYRDRMSCVMLKFSPYTV